jgi:cell wall-associated NlpC family hydrolase
MLRPVATRDALQAGDLVFFNTQQRTFSHVGIYLGDGRFIHAPRSGAQIRTESITTVYWSRRHTGASRVAAIDANP